MVVDRKPMVFTLPEEEDHVDDYSDDFYDLTISEAQALYKEFLNTRKELEDKPLKTAFMRSEEEEIKASKFVEVHKFCIVRIQFSDRIILQGIFEPQERFHEVNSFVRQHLSNKDLDFYLFSAPPKEVPDEALTLLELKFAPAVKLYLGVREEGIPPTSDLLIQSLRSDLHSLTSASDQAQLYRGGGPSKEIGEKERSKRSLSERGTSSGKASTSKPPKWFRPQ